jgi:hypothetical protein
MKFAGIIALPRIGANQRAGAPPGLESHYC